MMVINCSASRRLSMDIDLKYNFSYWILFKCFCFSRLFVKDGTNVKQEKLLAVLVEAEMSKRLKEGTYTEKKFIAICHFWGYQASGSLPSKFECDYASMQYVDITYSSHNCEEIIN